jgi:hypothetical protein
MRKLLMSFWIAAGLTSSASYAQMAGNAPSPGTADIRNSDLGAHDSFTTPDVHDMLLKQRADELSDRIRAQSKGLGPSRPAKASELSVGAPVNDNTGVAMAQIEKVDPDGVVLSLGSAKVKVPADAFGHNKAGLLLDMTKAQFEQVVTKASTAG